MSAAEGGMARLREILVVEDSPTQALQLRHLLEKNGYQVAVAADGEQALAWLRDHCPALIVSDIVMPGMNGYEMCHRIKADASLKHIPIVLLTCLADPQDVIRGLEAGADAFATKPYKEQSLLRRVESILMNRAMKESGELSEDGGVYFGGRKHALAAKPRQTIEFLLYTYEDAVEKNLDLMEARDALEYSNRELEISAAKLRERNAQMEDDMRMAREIQQAFLPRQYPRFPPTATEQESCVRISHLYQPSTTLGGDFFDVLSVSDTEAGVFVCDVVGHGLRAALVTAIIRGLVEDLASVAGDPGRFLTVLNRGLAAVFTRSDDPVFASAVYSVIDTTTGELRYANAGHPRPLHLSRAASTAVPLQLDREEQGPALGLFGEHAYATSRSRLAVGDLVVFFTDGVFEARGAGQEEFGQQRMKAALLRSLQLPLRQMFDALLAEVQQFTGARGLDDDVCLVAAELARLEGQYAGHGTRA